MDLVYYIIFGFLILLLLKVILDILANFNMLKKQYKAEYSVLQVQVPSENETSPIVAEQIFATLQGIKSSYGFWDRFAGKSAPTVSFEIASLNGQIRFFVAFPDRYRNLVEGQVYAQYPDAEIIDIKDYSRVQTYQNNFVSVDLKLSSHQIFPIKRHGQFEDKVNKLVLDPLAGITSSLVKFYNQEDQAWIQINISPLPTSYNKKLAKVVKIFNFVINDGRPS